MTLQYILRLFRAVVDILMLMILIIAVIGFKTWISSFTVPPEDSLVLVEGRVSSTKDMKRRGGSVAGVNFWLSGHPGKWSYWNDEPNYRKACSRLFPGARVRLWVPPKADRWRPQIWRFEVSGTTIVTFQMMESYSRRNGRWGLVLGIGSLAALAYLGRKNWQSSRASVIVKRWKRERERRQRVQQRRA